jgi:two-component system, chemotaxis family, chemotaxis protein CheY
MKRILVVDDSTPVRAAIRRILENFGFSVEEAANGEIALERCAANPGFDLVICDIAMPIMDGFTVVERLREDERFAELPIIICSTSTSFASIRCALELGANEFIMKPFDVEIVGSKLQACGLL